MFSENISAKAAEKPKREKKEPAPTVDAQRKAVAEVCGAIAGMPKGFRDAGEALRDVAERCDMAIKSPKTLTPKQAEQLAHIHAEVSGMMLRITARWKEVDAMISAGIALPEKAPTEDLF